MTALQTTAAGHPPRSVPSLGPTPQVTEPKSAERRLATGLHVVAVRRPGVPLVEIRLRVPFSDPDDAHPARSSMLSETLLTGTERRTQVELAESLQAVGASLSVSDDADRMLIGGAVLQTGLAALLELIAEVLTEATFPEGEIAVERDRMIEQLTIARSQPGVLVREALNRRLYGDHPYARELPEIAAVEAVDRVVLRGLYSRRVLPAGSVLILVGDLVPEEALDLVESALGRWDRAGDAAVLPPVPALQSGPIRVVHRPGSVQSSIRVAGRAVGRSDPGYPALQLTNLAFGGYFSSRLVENIREDKGYTYAPHSRVDHSAAVSALVVDADVATEVTMPALLEIWYELGRMAALPITQQELDDVRQYSIGTLAMSIATQSGLASMLSALSATGLGLDWLREYPRRLATVSLEDAYSIAHRVLAPSRLVTVVLGDADVIAEQLSTLAQVELVQ